MGIVKQDGKIINKEIYNYSTAEKENFIFEKINEYNILCYF